GATWRITSCPSTFAAAAIFAGGAPVTVIASSGAGVPTFAPVMPVIGLVVTWPRSRAGLRPTCLATVLIVDSAVTKFETSPSQVGAVPTGAAPPGASGWPRYTWAVALY